MVTEDAGTDAVRSERSEPHVHGAPPAASPGVDVSRDRGGRPTRDQTRQRLAERLANIDREIAERALKILDSKDAPDGAVVQAMLILQKCGEGAAPVVEPKPCQHDVPRECVEALTSLESQFKELVAQVETDMKSLKEPTA